MFGWNSEIGSNWSMELPVISSVLHRFTLDVTAPMELITRESCSYTHFHGYWFWCCLLNDEQENHPSIHFHGYWSNSGGAWTRHSWNMPFTRWVQKADPASDCTNMDQHWWTFHEPLLFLFLSDSRPSTEPKRPNSTSSPRACTVLCWQRIQHDSPAMLVSGTWWARQQMKGINLSIACNQE